MIFFDTETLPFKIENKKEYHRFRLGVALYVRIRNDISKDTKEYLYFDNIDDFWRFVNRHVRKKQTLYLLAHNVVFDLVSVNFIINLERLGFSCEYIYDNGYTFIASWRRDSSKIVCLNTANWFMGSVESFGELLGFPKLSMPDYGESNETWFKYCQRDVDILERLHNWYVEFIKQHSLGSWRYTIASSAYYAYRYRFMNIPIYIPKANDANNLARDAYHGGRTEVYRIGEYKNNVFYKLDVNSMYPYCMSNFEYPTELYRFGTLESIDQLDYLLERFCLIARVKVNTSEPWYPCQYNDRIIYPTGSFWTCLNTPELKLALAKGHITKTDTCAVFKKGKIFTNYVNFFYKLKQQYSNENNLVLRSFTKLYLNSLYGKFGQKGYFTEIIAKADYPDYRLSFGYDVRLNLNYKIMQIGRNILYSYVQGDSEKAFTAIASHVTAEARIYLYKLVTQAGIENVFYTDTDSLIVNQTGLENLRFMIHSTTLGSLKIEEMSDYLMINAPKDYIFGDHTVLKGIRKNAIEIGPNVYQQEQWPGLSSIYREDNKHYFIRTITKTLSREIKNAIVLPDNQIIPLRLTQ